MHAVGVRTVRPGRPVASGGDRRGAWNASRLCGTWTVSREGAAPGGCRGRHLGSAAGRRLEGAVRMVRQGLPRGHRRKEGIETDAAPGGHRQATTYQTVIELQTTGKMNNGPGQTRSVDQIGRSGRPEGAR